MNRNQVKEACQLCKKEFKLSELYPIALIRNAVVDTIKKQYPAFSPEGFICLEDLRRANALRFEEILKEDKGELTRLETEVLDSLKKQEILAENINKEFEERLTLGQRAADRIAKFGGSWTFLGLFMLVLCVWMVVNTVYILKDPFDPYPFILLNLFLSCLAAIQAPIIMMSQNRQAAKDRLLADHEYTINLKAELQIRQLNAKLDLFMKHQWERLFNLYQLQHELWQDVGKKGRSQKDEVGRIK